MDREEKNNESPKTPDQAKEKAAALKKFFEEVAKRKIREKQEEMDR